MENDFNLTLELYPPPSQMRQKGWLCFLKDLELNRKLSFHKDEEMWIWVRHSSFKWAAEKCPNGHNLLFRISQTDLISYSLNSWLSVTYCLWGYINSNVCNKGNRKVWDPHPVMLIPGLESCIYLCKTLHLAHEINQKQKIIMNCIDAMANTRSHTLKMENAFKFC